MKKTWSPQFRSKLLYNPILLGCVIVFLVIVTILHNRTEGFVFLLFVIAGVCYWYHKNKAWDMGGYRTITIDKDNRMVIFDNNVRIPIRAIEEVGLIIEEPPRRIFNTRDIPYNINEFNGFLDFTLKTGEKINFSVQFRNEAQDIIENLRDCGLPIEMSDVAKCDITGQYQLAWVLITCVPALLWFLWKLFINR